MKRWFSWLSVGVRNCISWFPVIWRDRDYDYEFLFLLISFKLDRMERYFVYQASYVGVEEVVAQIQTANLALKRLIADEYGSELFTKVRDEWREVTLYPEYEGAEYDVSAQQAYNVAVKQCLQQEDALRKKDLKLVFNTLRDHSPSWWD
jgi:hypothetical protein